MIIDRAISDRLAHFKDKLLFISGPRQAGKTFIIEHQLKPALELNMDVAKDRLAFRQFPDFIVNWYRTTRGAFPRAASTRRKPLVFIDEIHKVQGWRNLIKGTYDKTKQAVNYVASGSSAFAMRRQDQGDSLAGRAVWLTLFPVTFREYVKTMAPEIVLEQPWKAQTPLTDLVRKYLPHQKRLRALWENYAAYGSFPENLVRKDPVFYRQWLEDYVAAMLDRDLKDLHLAKDVERVYHVFQLLLAGLGSTYSLRNLAETLQVSPNTVKSDIRALKQVLWGFELPVAGLSKSRQIRKEKKFYPVDFCFSRLKEPLSDGAPFECTVACLLARGLASETSEVLGRLQLGFYRDYDRREVDFVVRDKRGIRLAVECKLKVKNSSGALDYLARFRPTERILAVEEPNIFGTDRGIFSISIELLAVNLE
ncbi:MAG: ATP-binding protein [Deltaproteobacteria bacterium]|nr:ATP-binding protein [Deltaproteobacteria bacterium]